MNETHRRIAHTHFTAHDEQETHKQVRRLAEAAHALMMAANSEIFGMSHAGGKGSIYEAARMSLELLLGPEAEDTLHEEGELRPDCSCGCGFGTHGEWSDLNGYTCERCFADSDPSNMEPIGAWDGKGDAPRFYRAGPETAHLEADNNELYSAEEIAPLVAIECDNCDREELAEKSARAIMRAIDDGVTR